MRGLLTALGSDVILSLVIYLKPLKNENFEAVVNATEGLLNTLVL